MTMPAAWIDGWRTWPSIRWAMARSWAIFEFRSLSSRSSGTFFRPSAMVESGPNGIILATRSTSGRGTSRTRPTSRMAPRAAIVPKVMI